MTKQLSPMMAHYLTLKEKYKDAIVLYRLGDFYEMFFDDAKIASKVLDLTLTGRDCGLDERAPMCGMPYHAVNNYIAKLIEAGFNVAICEQLSEPEKSRMVERDVVRVITPGTVVEDNILNEKQSNYLAAAFESKNEYAVAWTDLSTGEFYVCQVDGLIGLEDMLNSISPAEIICVDSLELIGRNLQSVKFGKLPKFKKYFDWAFKHSSASECLKGQFKASTLEAFEIDDKPSCVACAGGLMEYLLETQKRSLLHIKGLKLITQSNFMFLDSNTKRNLELSETLREKKKKGSLLYVLDKTKTNMGARNLKKWLEQPLISDKIINHRLDAVEEFINNPQLRREVDNCLGEIRDIERLVAKISYGSLNPRDCLSISTTLAVLPQLKTALKEAKSYYLKKVFSDIDTEKVLAKLLAETIDDNPPNVLKDGGFIKSGFHKDLDNERFIMKNASGLIAELEARERELTEIKTLKVGYNRVFGYYIEVSNLNKDKVPTRYIRKQTLANNERFITEELKNIEEKILSAETNAIKIENEIFVMIKQCLGQAIASLQKTAKAISDCDCLLSFAQVSLENKYVKPIINSKIKHIQIVGGRHPVVETLLNENEFISNDTILDCKDNRMAVITGPNMAGKSTYMRQTALITLMAHLGCFVPAKSAEISITDRIFTRVGASDDVAYGQSTFMVEMIEVATILQNATVDSLVILDEIGRGTSTYDGLSIAWSVLEYITKTVKAKTLFSTHYHELSELEGMLDGVKNYKVLVNESNNSIIFLHKIARGGANKSFGIEVASLAGVPSAVTDRAKEIASHLEIPHIDAEELMKGSLHARKTEQSSLFEEDNSYEIMSILKDVNLENYTPLQTMLLLSDLKEKAIKG